MKKGRKIVIGFESYPDFSDNSRAMYDYIREKCSDKYDLVWLLTDKNNRNRHNNIKCIHPEDDNFENEFNKIDTILSTQFFYSAYKKKFQTWICLWHGGGYKNVGKFSEGESYSFINVNATKIDYFLSTSRFMSAIFSCELALKYEKFLEFGSPRVDLLLSDNSKDNLSIVLGGVDVNKYKKVIFYLPTFKNGAGRKEGYLNTSNSLGCLPYDEEDLNSFLQENNYLLITKLHPTEINSINTKKYSNIKIISNQSLTESDIDLHNILGSADLLVTDYSSIAKDFLNLERPVSYVHSDFDDYNTRRGIVFGDYELWFPGPRISTIKEFMKESKKLLTDKEYYRGNRIRTNRVTNGSYEFDAREKVLDFIENKLYKNVSAMERRLVAMERRLALAADENEILRQQNGQLMSRECSIAEECQVLLHRLRELENSTSWKITKPTRDAASMIRKIKKGI